MLGLTFISASLGIAVGSHHTHLREQRGKEIEAQTNSALTYVPATLPFSDNGYLRGTVTPQEIECLRIPERNRRNYRCSISFFEFPEIPASLEVYVPKNKGGTVDDIIAVCEEKPKLCNNYDVQILEHLSIVQKAKHPVYLNAVPKIDSSHSLYVIRLFELNPLQTSDFIL